MIEENIIFMPEIGNKDMEVIEILVSVGETVTKSSGIISVESDKASVEIPSTLDGTVEKIYIKVGEKIKSGSPILGIKTDNIFSSKKNHENLIYASPSARKLARESNLNIEKIFGSGNKGRVTLEDVKSLINLNHLPDHNYSTQDTSKILKSKTLNKIKQISLSKLMYSWSTIPHVTHHGFVDITNLESFREELNHDQKEIKLTFLPFVMKAVSITLRKFPLFNSVLKVNEIIYNKFINLGFAVDTQNGILIPVIKNVDAKGILEIAREIKYLSEKAKTGNLLPNEMQDGCFTISSLGGIGGTVHFTPIINSPEVAILGICKAIEQLTLKEQNKIIQKLMLPISLSYDHRVIDGMLASEFIIYFSALVSDPRRIIL